MKKQDTNKKALEFFKVLSHSLSDKILPLLSKKRVTGNRDLQYAENRTKYVQCTFIQAERKRHFKGT